jgi:acyl-coenzyme A thioesterase PaaI-like protein
MAATEKPSSRTSQGLFAKRPPSARLLRWMFNVWPTYFFAGVRVRALAVDFTSASVELRLGLLNRNYVGTAFGGTLFSMTDPFWMLLMLRQLGPGFVVWDRAASIKFLKPGRGRIRAEFSLPPAEVERVRALVHAATKIDQSYTVQLLDAGGVVVAEVEKTLYIRAL